MLAFPPDFDMSDANMKVVTSSPTPLRRRCSVSFCGLAALVLFAAGVAARSQGTVAFGNTLSTLIYTNSAPGGPPTGIMSGPFGISYYFAMLAAPAGTTNLSAFSFTGGYASNYFVDGGFDGGIVTISNTQPGQAEAVWVVGWSANMGPNYSDVTNYLADPTFTAWYGQSLIATVALGDDFPQPQTPFGTFPGQVPGFILDEHVAVPEPAPFGLLLVVAVVAGISGYRKHRPGRRLFARAAGQPCRAARVG